AARSAGGYSSWFLSVLQQGPHGGVSAWLALVVVPVAVAEDDGLHALVPVVFLDADSDSEVVACAESRVWADEGVVFGGVGDLSESGWSFAVTIECEVAHFWSPMASWIVVYMSQGQFMTSAPTAPPSVMAAAQCWPHMPSSTG